MGLTLLSPYDRHDLLRRLAHLREGGVPAALDAVRHRLSYRDDAFLLRRDLTVPFPVPAARLPLGLRELEERDVAVLLDPTAPGLDDADRRERRARLDMLHAGLRTPYVAVDDDDRPQYVQWLLGPDQDEAVARHFGGTFPRIGPGEALLEGAYTPVTARGKRVMPHAMARIAELGVGLGAHSVTTFVSQGNGASLAGCERAGFVVAGTRTVSVRLLRQRVVFGPAPAPAGGPPLVG